MVKTKRKKRLKLTEQQKSQNLHQKEIRTVFQNMGYTRIPNVDGKEFAYEGVTSEFDDLFYYENIVIFMEYTTAAHPSDHLKNKKILYDNILKAKIQFIEFFVNEKKFESVKRTIENNILKTYTINQLQIVILYASREKLSQEHKDLVKVVFFDYPIVKYFETISKVIKKTTLHEFHSFLNLPNSNIGSNILKSTTCTQEAFDGHILPEEHSSFKKGYKLISFYIDANSLMKRAYVLRNGSWKDKGQIPLYQRLLSLKKINAMRKYLYGEDRVFVNNIIATLPEDKIKLYDSNDNEIKVDGAGNLLGGSATKPQPAKISIENDVNIIGIIDGQHRTFAYHEGTDRYEEKISKLRNIQNLLVTGILFPKKESLDDRLRFQAKLFLEVNSNQQSAASALKHEIESSLDPFSTTSISKYVLNELNESGPLASCFELYWYERNKIKVTTIISYGLKPIVKFDSDDTFYSLWNNNMKDELKRKEDSDLLREYRNFCVKELRIFLDAFKANFSADRWVVNNKDHMAVLNLTFINAAVNCLRLLIKNGKTGDGNYYKNKLSEINKFDFKTYKTTHYKRMGSDWYTSYFA